MKHLKDIQFGDFEVSILEEVNQRGYVLDIRDDDGENLAGFYMKPDEINFETENIEKVLTYVLENEKKHFEEDETPDETHIFKIALNALKELMTEKHLKTLMSR